MSWAMTAMAVAGAVAGKLENDAQKDQENSDRKLAANTQRYSYITGNKAGPIRHAGSATGAVLGGAASGASMAQGLKGAFGGAGGAAGSAMPTQKPSMYANVYGGQDMASKLGNFGQNLSPMDVNSGSSAPSFGGGSSYANLGNTGNKYSFFK